MMIVSLPPVQSVMLIMMKNVIQMINVVVQKIVMLAGINANRIVVSAKLIALVPTNVQTFQIRKSLKLKEKLQLNGDANITKI